MDREHVIVVIEHSGEKWEVAQPCPDKPGEVDPNTVIVRMFYIEGAVEVYARPTDGRAIGDGKVEPVSPFAGKGINFIYTLAPLAIKRIIQVADVPRWTMMMAETEAALDGEEEEEDDEPEVQVTPQAAQSPPPGLPGGFGQVIGGIPGTGPAPNGQG